MLVSPITFFCRYFSHYAPFSLFTFIIFDDIHAMRADYCRHFRCYAIMMPDAMILLLFSLIFIARAYAMLMPCLFSPCFFAFTLYAMLLWRHWYCCWYYAAAAYYASHGGVTYVTPRARQCRRILPRGFKMSTATSAITPRHMPRRFRCCQHAIAAAAITPIGATLLMMPLLITLRCRDSRCWCLMFIVTLIQHALLLLLFANITALPYVVRRCCHAYAWYYFADITLLMPPYYWYCHWWFSRRWYMPLRYIAAAAADAIRYFATPMLATLMLLGFDYCRHAIAACLLRWCHIIDYYFTIISRLRLFLLSLLPLFELAFATPLRYALYLPPCHMFFATLLFFFAHSSSPCLLMLRADCLR